MSRNHTHNWIFIKIDEFYGDYIYSKCKCGAIKGEPLEEKDKRDIYEQTSNF